MCRPGLDNLPVDTTDRAQWRCTSLDGPHGAALIQIVALHGALRAADNISAAKPGSFYAERYRAGLRVRTSVTEVAANFLVNR
jgi:hypothetical protein